MTLLTLFAVIVAAALLAEVAWQHHKQHPARLNASRRAAIASPDAPAPTTWPSLTVIRPIKGLDAGLEENLEAAFNHDYLGEVETLFVLDSPQEPAVPVLRRVIEAQRVHDPALQARVMFCGEPPVNRTGKLHAMIKALRVARGEHVIFADSDTRADRRTLTNLVETLHANPDAGSVFAPVWVDSRPETLGDAGYATLLNSVYAPAAARIAADNDGALPFIMGQFMLVRRDAIRSMGGLEDAEGQLVDDMYIGARLHQEGWRNIMASRPVPIIESGMSLRGFIRKFCLWLTFGRSGLPLRGFKVQAARKITATWLGIVGATVAALASAPFIATLFGLGAAAAITSSVLHHRALGGAGSAVKMASAMLLVTLLGPVLQAWTAVRREVSWRGRAYKIDGKGRLELTSGVHRATAATIAEEVGLASRQTAA